MGRDFLVRRGNRAKRGYAAAGALSSNLGILVPYSKRPYSKRPYSKRLPGLGSAAIPADYTFVIG